MFKWFDAKESKEFGEQLAQYLIANMSSEDPKKNKNSIKKRADVLVQVLKKVEGFKASHRLNIYQKAQLGNALRWKLQEAGFEDGFVTEATHLVITSL